MVYPSDHGTVIFIDTQARFFQNSAWLNGSESGGEFSPARFFASSRPAIAETTRRGNRKEIFP
jgi:hypothetical protein